MSRRDGTPGEARRYVGTEANLAEIARYAPFRIRNAPGSIALIIRHEAVPMEITSAGWACVVGAAIGTAVTLGLTTAIRAFIRRRRASRTPPPIVSPNTIDDKVTFRVYEQFFNNFRHWDQIRWNVSTGFLAFIASIVSATFALLGERAAIAQLVFIFVSIISALWTILLYRLIRYHNKALDHLHRTLDSTKNFQSSDVDALVGVLPFRLEGPDFRKTASFIFFMTFTVIAFGSLVVAVTWYFHLFPYESLFTTQPKTTDDKDTHIADLQQAVVSGDKHIEDLHTEAKNRDAQIGDIQSRLEKENSEIKALQGRLAREQQSHMKADEFRLSKAQWISVQGALKRHNLYGGRIDGDPGDAHPERSGTRAAIRSWQSRLDQPATGYLTRDQFSKLTTASP